MTRITLKLLGVAIVAAASLGCEPNVDDEIADPLPDVVVTDPVVEPDAVVVEPRDETPAPEVESTPEVVEVPATELPK